jgi:hypothetical protein
MEREMKTGDSNNDLAFTVSNTVTDKMIIDTNRAQLWFNKSTYANSLKVPSSTTPLEITIYGGAIVLRAAAAALSVYLLI